jgi:hypothetical protein
MELGIEPRGGHSSPMSSEDVLSPAVGGEPACGAHAHRRPAPPVAVPVPTGRPVPAFRPIRRGCGLRHRLRPAGRRWAGAVSTGLFAAGCALAAQHLGRR